MMEMKRALRVLFKTVIVLLLLPLILVYGIFLYVKFVNPGAEKTMKETTEFLEQKRSSGNGFGGESGLQRATISYFKQTITQTFPKRAARFMCGT